MVVVVVVVFIIIYDYIIMTFGNNDISNFRIMKLHILKSI